MKTVFDSIDNIDTLTITQPRLPEAAEHKAMQKTGEIKVWQAHHDLFLMVQKMQSNGEQPIGGRLNSVVEFFGRAALANPQALLSHPEQWREHQKMTNQPLKMK